MSEKKSSKNAFSLLLAKQTKKKANAPSHSETTFIKCPCCHRHIHHANINIHLDKCIVDERNETPKKQDHNTEINSASKSQTQSTDISPKTIQLGQENDQESKSSNLKQSQILPKRKDAFAAMNENAKKMYKKTALKRQGIHLENEEGRLRWYDLDKEAMSMDRSNCKWSSSVLIKGYDENPDIELIISSALPSSKEWMPLVRRHSKFSVSVLKSILQKSIRRRRPMPSVRVAMELADKSFGDLIRRLPIIILEDGFLHPDVPLLVWTMIASSKDFIPSRGLVKKIMTIVFELCSMPWKDELNRIDDVDIPSYGLHDIQSLEISNTVDDSWALILKALILRRHYGGMTCDIKMLNTYIWVWKQRLGCCIDLDLVKKCFPSYHEASLCWDNVPTLLYSMIKSNSITYVHPVIDHGLDALSFSDIHASGIDFHVSHIVNELMDPVFIKQTDELLRRTLSEPERIDIYKSWMWKYSSSVNHRRAFVSHPPPTEDENHAKIKEFWNDVAMPILNRFTTMYIMARLAK
jgi:hypothetical protein